MSTMQTATVQTLAEEASQWFTAGPRESEFTGQPIRILKDDRPEWVLELVRVAHGEFFPDDWRYDMIEDALNWIAECDDPEDATSEFADQAVDVYNGTRVKWLASSIYRGAYCDQARDEFGGDDVQTDGIYGAIGLGQYMEAQEIYLLVLQQLEAQLDAIADES